MPPLARSLAIALAALAGCATTRPDAPPRASTPDLDASTPDARTPGSPDRAPASAPIRPGAPAGAPRGPALFRVIVPVADLAEAVRFYARVLDAPGERVSDGRHYFDCGGTILACFDPRADGDGYDASPLPEWLYLAVDDLGAVRERCRAAGASFEPGGVGGSPAGEIAQRPWGERSFYVRDPSGNGLCFVQRGTEFTGAR